MKCPECGGTGMIFDSGAVGAMMLGEGGGFDGTTEKPCPACNGTGQAPTANLADVSSSLAEAPESGERDRVIRSLVSMAVSADEDQGAWLASYTASDFEGIKALVEADGELESALRELVEKVKALREGSALRLLDGKPRIWKVPPHLMEAALATLTRAEALLEKEK